MGPNISPKPPSVCKPTALRLAAPPVYRPQQSVGPSLQLRPANNLGVETRSAPPVYRPNQDNVSSAQLKPASNLGSQTRPVAGKPFTQGPQPRAVSPNIVLPTAKAGRNSIIQPAIFFGKKKAN
jgi:hypothetical protein